MKSLILIDVAGIWHANWHVSKDQEFGEAFEATVRKVHALKAGYDYCAVTYDIGPYKRLDISPDYKSNREKKSDVFYDQYKRVLDRLRADGLCVLGVKGLESDDVIATLVEQLRGKYEIRISSADKDLCQLVSSADHVSVASHMTGNVMTDDKVREKFGVNPADMLDFLSLVGDKADAINGVPSVGPVLAAKIINSAPGLAGILAGEDAEEVTPRINNLVREHREVINLARRLITLDTNAPVDANVIFEERKAQPVAGKGEQFQEEEETDMPEKVTEAEFTDENLGALFGSEGPIADLVNAQKNNAPRTAELRDSERVPEVPALQVPVVTKPVFKPEQTTALAKVTVRFEDQLEPNSLTNAGILAEKIVNSRLYSNFPNADATLAIILTGREMNLRAMEALRCLIMVEGKVTLSSHLIIARAKADPDCEYFRFIGGDDTYAEWETKHRDDPEPTRHKYTMDQAQQAGVAPAVIQKRKEGDGKDSRGQWSKRPAEMLRKSAAVQLVRIVFPAASLGIYSTEELEN